MEAPTEPRPTWAVPLKGRAARGASPRGEGRAGGLFFLPELFLPELRLSTMGALPERNCLQGQGTSPRDMSTRDMSQKRRRWDPAVEDSMTQYILHQKKIVVIV
jgi:hypothetical protein